MTTVSPHTVISSFMPANKIIKKVKKKKNCENFNFLF